MLLYVTLGIYLGLTFAVEDKFFNSQRRVDEESYYPNVHFSDTFDWKLLKEFSSKYRNVLISPISIKLILALLYQGSSGATEREFQNVLQFVDKKTVDKDYAQIISTLQATGRSEYLLNMGTSVFLDSRIQPNPNFQRKANQIYRTEIRPVDFLATENASHVVNSWVEQLTNGKVSQLVKPDDLQQTIMLIANAVYFKGTWHHPFPKDKTHSGKFFISSETMNDVATIDVPYMSTKDQFYIKESPQLDSKILRLPYKGSDYSMFIILPNSLGGLPNLIKKINLNNLSSMLYSLEKRLVEVNIPKFKFSFKAKMGEALQSFGLRQMFQNTASFTGMTKGNSSLLRQLVVSDILQKSGIELDEEGSVVYSATDVNIGNKFGEPRDVFNATHPFLFFIEGPNGTILFNGKVENPLEDGELPLPNRSGSESTGGENPAPELGAAQAQAHPNPPQFTSNGQNVLPISRPVYQEQTQEQVPNLQPGPNLEPNSYEMAINLNKEELAYRFNLFDAELLSAFSDSNENVFISPASIKTTLAMILEGARGSCATEISEALRIPNIEQQGVREILMGLLNTFREKSGSTFLENSNAIFASDRYKILDKYRKAIEEFYRGNIKNVNFKNVGNAIATINNWVSDATHGSIKEIVGPSSITTGTSVVIANALYFKGKWKTSFDPENTKPKCFQTPNRCVLTPMMRVSASFNYNYISRLRTHAIQIPYENNFSMLILMPSENVSIRSMIRDLLHTRLGDIVSNLRSSDIILQIPKFQIDYSADLIEYLKPLRIQEIFGEKANLSGIVENGNVLVNSLVHKTRIEVDEQGTVASAATGAIVIPLIGSTTVIVNRPFVFCIYHEPTENIVFEGILINPQDQNPAPDVLRTASRNLNQHLKIRSRQFK